jgi:putative ABC transport system permease protein
VLGIRTLAGSDAATALAAPDTVVLTESAARKYFGAGNAVGGTVDFNRSRSMRVTAIIPDLPSNSHLDFQILASGLTRDSRFAREDTTPQKVGVTAFAGWLYVRLKPGVAPQTLVPRLADFAIRHFPEGEDGDDAHRSPLTFKLDPIADVHLLPYARDIKQPGDPAVLASVGLIGLVILVLAAINFINLMTARAARRAIEVGVRKALGATRRQLVVQFMGEALGFAAGAACLAVALVEAATLVIVHQTAFATGAALHFDTDQVALVRGAQACKDSFRNRVRDLPGVAGAVCSRAAPLDFSGSDGNATTPDGRQLEVDRVEIDFDFLEFYGFTPLAGRFFDRGHGGDAAPPDDNAVMSASIVINETAMRAMGFASPDAAIGQSVTVSGIRDKTAPSPIIGVVRDFPIGSIRHVIQPSVFFVSTDRLGLLSVRLKGGQIPATLAAIDRIWSEDVADLPIWRLFLNAEIDRTYRDIERQGVIFAGFAGIAIAIGCLGLFGLSAFAAERRTKEIGIRKALGASTFDVVRLLIWQFVKPVLIANALAWPIAWWFMRRWLDGFAYRIDLDAEPFLAAGAAALAIAVLTTAFHAVQVARSRPVLALRYE